jgi:hypothetical protein
LTVLPAQPGQTNVVNTPGVLMVYADSNTQTQLVTNGTIAAGSLLRFNGLIFNDNGTLRMDCGWIRDGVPL